MRDTKHAPSLAIMLGVGHGDDHEGDEEPTSKEEITQAKKDAASALINAVKSDNADAVVDAMETLYELCEAEPEEDESDEEDEDKPSLADLASEG